MKLEPGVHNKVEPGYKGSSNYPVDKLGEANTTNVSKESWINKYDLRFVWRFEHKILKLGMATTNRNGDHVIPTLQVVTLAIERNGKG